MGTKVFIAGHQGMVGSAVVRRLTEHGLDGGECEILTAPRAELDLTRQAAVEDFFASRRPDCVVLAAAKVGGIHANHTYPAEFLQQNLLIQANIIDAAWRSGVQRLLFLGSSCIYPKLAPQPMPEAALLSGTLEPTNEPYAIAKIAGIKLCESYNRQYGTDYRSLMPTNLYGPGDNFHPENSHVLPALMRRFDEAARAAAEEVVVWGSGRPRREFLHVDDLAAAVSFCLELSAEEWARHTQPMQSHVNVGTGVDLSIAELATAVADVTGFQGRISYDATKPDGTPRKLLDVSRLQALGWSARITLAQGLASTYDWYQNNMSVARR